jgi:hypothetical protein
MLVESCASFIASNRVISLGVFHHTPSMPSSAGTHQKWKAQVVDAVDAAIGVAVLD